MSELSTDLAASSNQPVADSTPTIDATLDAAFESSPEPAAGSDPSGTTEPAHEPVAATQQPQTHATPEVGAKGEPPRERWDTILANARTKAAQDAREQALAENREHLEVVAELKRDYPGTLARLLEEGSSDPRFAAVITAKAAALLNARKVAAKADEEPQPDAVMKFEDGSTEPTYSPAQQRKWAEWRERQMKSELLTEFKPLIELRQQFDQHKQVQQAAKEAASIAEERGASWKTMPLFADHKDAIMKRQQEIYAEAEAAAQRGERTLDPINAPWTALQQAYSEVISTQALPKLHGQQTESLVASAARKRAATSSDPAATAPAQPRRARTVDEALDQVFDGVGV